MTTDAPGLSQDDAPKVALGDRLAWPDFVIPLVLALVFWLLVIQNLGFPSTPVFDEAYTLPAGQQIVEGKVPTEQTHPPLTKLLMAASYQLMMGGRFAPATDAWSPVAYSMRMPSAIAGALSLALLFAWVRSLTGRRRTATLAAVFLACDGLFIVFSRTAMLNVYSVMFSIAGCLGLWLALKHRRQTWLLLAGLGFGCAIASRWTSSVPLLVSALFFAHFVWQRHQARQPGERSDWAPWALSGALTLGVLPLLVYALSYTQILLATYHDPWAILKPAVWWELFQHTRSMVQIHTGYTTGFSPNLFHSAWWTWPLMLRPAWFSFSYNPTENLIMAVWGIGNAFVWWASLPAMVYAAWRVVRHREPVLGWLGALAAALWLVWILAGSRVTLMHYMFEAIPYVCVIIAIAWVRVWDAARAGEATDPPDRLSGAKKAGLGVYVGLVLWWTWYYHPLLVARPISVEAYTQHMWLGLDNWELISIQSRFRREQGLTDKAQWEQFLRKSSGGEEFRVRPLAEPSP